MLKCLQRLEVLITGSTDSIEIYDVYSFYFFFGGGRIFDIRTIFFTGINKKIDERLGANYLIGVGHIRF
jgi:hypothetical protein